MSSLSLFSIFGMYILNNLFATAANMLTQHIIFCMKNNILSLVFMQLSGLFVKQSFCSFLFFTRIYYKHTQHSNSVLIDGTQLGTTMGKAMPGLQQRIKKGTEYKFMHSLEILKQEQDFFF